MLKLVTVLLLSSLGFSYERYTDEPQDCDNLGTLFYEDIGCRPVTVEGKDCPVEFKCDDFTIKNDSCLFKSRTVKVGETIDDALTMTEPSCKAKCVCNDARYRNRGLFTCLIPVCPKRQAEQAERGCYFAKTSINQCCESKMICPSDPDVAKCQWREQYGHPLSTHYEGAMMNDRSCDRGSCSDCICLKGFEGNLVEPFCNRIPCLVQLKHSDKLAENCAPVYQGQYGCHLCCPYAFACPKDTDVIQQLEYHENNSGLKCKFGSRTVKLGEGLETTVGIRRMGENITKNVRCKCILPPFLTCRDIIP